MSAFVSAFVSVMPPVPVLVVLIERLNHQPKVRDYSSDPGMLDSQQGLWGSCRLLKE